MRYTTNNMIRRRYIGSRHIKAGKSSPRYFERRKYLRFRVKGSALVFFERPRGLPMSGSKVVRIGPVADISTHGMAIEYMVNRDRIGDTNRLSIEIPGQGILLDRIPVHTCRDYRVAVLDSGQEIRRRCIRFGQLNQHQLHRLHRFLADCTRGKAHDRRSGLERRYPSKASDPFIAKPGWENDKGRRRKPERRRLYSSVGERR